MNMKIRKGLKAKAILFFNSLSCYDTLITACAESEATIVCTIWGRTKFKAAIEAAGFRLTYVHSWREKTNGEFDKLLTTASHYKHKDLAGYIAIQGHMDSESVIVYLKDAA